jgi:hypothetical protein
VQGALSPLEQSSMLGVIAFGRGLFHVTNPRIFYEVRAWEARGGIYRELRVPDFGRLLRRSPLRLLNPTVYLNRSPMGMIEALRQVEAAEAAHWWAAMLLCVFNSAVQGWWGVVGWFVLIQIFGNLCPILHLRWVRIRLKPMID